MSSAKSLRELQAAALDNLLSPEQAAHEWLIWFEDKGTRLLKTVARFGHPSITLDLPLELSTEVHKHPFTQIAKTIKILVPGVKVNFVEEECDRIFKQTVEISWA